MRDHSKHIQISCEEVVSGLLAACNFSPKTEMVRLDESFGRVLDEGVASACMLPNALTCRMDSIAVHWSDFVEGMPDTSDGSAVKIGNLPIRALLCQKGLIRLL